MAEVTWLDWVKIAAVLVAYGASVTIAAIGMFWWLTEPLGRGPKRIVDVRNRGLTRIRMPDGTIK